MPQENVGDRRDRSRGMEEISLNSQGEAQRRRELGPSTLQRPSRSATILVKM